MAVLKIKKEDGSWEVIAGAGGGADIELDTTLTQEGMAADAKAVGAAIDALEVISAVDENDDGNIVLGDFLTGGAGTDPFLTTPGKAADAKAVGDAINALREELLGGAW